MRAALALAFLLLACATTNSASGTFAGRAWSSSDAEVRYCEHCAGGLLLIIVFKRPGAHEGKGDFVVLESAAAPARHKPKRLRVEQAGEATTHVRHHTDEGGTVDAVDGEVEVEECTPEFVRLWFRARFADGSSVSGAVATKPVDDPGYD
jgi:hypothetical protein